MLHTPTPHISAKPGDFGKTVLMPGDPLRSKFIAENFLENPVLVNNVRGVVAAQAACTNSNYMAQFGMPGTFAPIASWELLREAVKAAEENGAHYHVGNLNSSDVFYGDHVGVPEGLDSVYGLQKMGVLALEMEAAALYMNAARYGKRALAICTISDSIVTGEETTSEERQTAFTTMMRVALDVAAAMERK